jgi:hypothetical protein
VLLLFSSIHISAEWVGIHTVSDEEQTISFR